MGNICSDDKKLQQNLAPTTQQQPAQTVNLRKESNSDANAAQKELQNQNLQNEIAQLKKEQAELRLDIFNKQKLNETLKQQLSDEKNKNEGNSAEKNEISKLKKQIEELKAQLKDAISQKEQEILKKQEEIQNKQEIHEEKEILAQQILQKDEEIQKLNVKYDYQKNQIKELEEELNSIKNETTNLKNENINLKNLNFLNQSAEIENNQIQKDLIQAQLDIENLNKIKAELEEQLNASKIEINNFSNLQSLYDINMQEIEKKNQKIALLQQDYKNLAQQNINQESEISILKIDLDNKTKELIQEQLLNQAKIEDLNKQLIQKSVVELSSPKKIGKSHTIAHAKSVNIEEDDDESDDSLNMTEAAVPDRNSQMPQNVEFNEQQATPEQLEIAKQEYQKCIEILKQAKEFTKHGRQTVFGRGQKRKFVFNEDFSKFCFVPIKEKQFNKKGNDKVFDVTSIMEIKDGMQTQNFQKIKAKKSNQENLAFSIVFKSRTVDLISNDKDEEQLQNFKEALKKLHEIKQLYLFNGNEFTGFIKVQMYSMKGEEESKENEQQNQ